MAIQQSELILNEDGSIYHLNLKPGDIAKDILFVGDQERVDKITKWFDSIEFTTQKREFKTTTGIYKGKRISVISTGIGPDNIDIVLNELDAIVNINLATRALKETHYRVKYYSNRNFGIFAKRHSRRFIFNEYPCLGFKRNASRLPNNCNFRY